MNETKRVCPVEAAGCGDTRRITLPNGSGIVCAVKRG